VRSFPQEDTRLTVPREFLEQHIINMHRYVEGTASELLFNLDEVGASDWEDRKPKKVFVSISLSETEIFHEVSRKFRHQSLLACVSAAGDSVTPLIINCLHNTESIWTTGLRENEDLMLRFRDPAYIDEEIFFEYISTIFVPYVQCIPQSNSQFRNQSAVLLLDSCPAHTSERILEILGKNAILAVTFPAHTTNLFQGLDLVLFGVLKKKKQTEELDGDTSPAISQITKLLNAYECAATSSNIRGAFRKAGFLIDTKTNPFRVKFDDSIVRENPGFKELWERNFSLSNISARRRNSPFGFINERYFTHCTPQ
jgi:hypothetical protein